MRTGRRQAGWFWDDVGVVTLDCKLRLAFRNRDIACDLTAPFASIPRTLFSLAKQVFRRRAVTDFLCERFGLDASLSVVGIDEHASDTAVIDPPEGVPTDGALEAMARRIANTDPRLTVPAAAAIKRDADGQGAVVLVELHVSYSDIPQVQGLRTRPTP